jgi:coenzyme F420 hydrogenase subunit beta
MKIQNVYQAAKHRLCVGCGACVYACPEGKVRLIDIINDGIRPVIDHGECNSCNRCLMICPGIETILPETRSNFDGIPYLKKRWGTILEMWEGYAADLEIRFKGSSGGLCTALSLYCIEKGQAGGVLHVGANHEHPWKNKTYMSTTKKDLLARTGSRYSPASPCDGLKNIEIFSEPSVFVGKPCDLAGLRKAQLISPELNRKMGLAIGFFCAGTPSTLGTLNLLRNYKVDPEKIANLRYRGKGWPGMATVQLKGEDKPSVKVSYKDSWGFVQKYRPFRCYLCPDLTAEFADISVGDPWYREISEDEHGQSIILIRTEVGRRIFREAMNSGYVIASKANPEILYRSQKNLLGKRQAIWGRILAMKMLGLPHPRLEGFHLFDNWLELPIKEKFKSVLGTARRIIQRKYFKPLDYSSFRTDN